MPVALTPRYENPLLPAVRRGAAGGHEATALRDARTAVDGDRERGRRGGASTAFRRSRPSARRSR
ncbi:hypothetical protein ACL07V_04885 [Streptomyces sp. MB22_4]|uniref:hypothetical protein n=1 Tax=Streptomyces sp. MB22_4 TaxID=3383120 RepID=UPI0039A26AAA